MSDAPGGGGVDDLAAQVQALAGEIAQLRLLADNVPVAIAYYESAGNTCRFANRRYAEMFGFDERSIVGRGFAEVIGDEAARAIAPYRDRVVEERVQATYERRLTDAEGIERVIEVNMLPHVGEHGASVGAFVLIADITHFRRAEAALRESEERLAKFMHASEEGIVFHKGGYVTDANPPLLSLLGFTLEEMLGRSTLEFIAPEQRERVAAVIAAAPEIRYDSVALHRDGTRIPVQFIVRTMHFQGEAQRMTIVRDLRDRIEAERRIQHLAHHDALTGLPNRLAFAGQLEQRLAQARERGDTLALMFVDLDHFKRINDSLGHAAGDTLLRTVAARITETLRAGDLVARFGGDEFLVLLAPRSSAEVVAEVAARLLAAIGAPLQAAGVALSVTPSIGMALFPRDGHTPEALIQHADLAMYSAKTGGRARCRFYEPAMAAAAQAELTMESLLAQAVHAQQFVLHFQPQVAPVDGRLHGVEALVRWQHPERGLVPPDEFIPVAESRRLILPLGQWVLRQALRAADELRRVVGSGVPVAVNLSTQQFQAASFADTVVEALAESGLEGAQLELELTERMLMDDVHGVRQALLRLRQLGVTITVDDFGTGYTSLAHLKELPLDRLKIDRSFITGLPGDAGAAAIARAMVAMAHGLGLQVVAEGVESEAQRSWALEHGCDAMQGFLVAEPMTLPQLLRWLQARAAP